MSAASFRVHLQAVEPAMSWNAWRHWTLGQLDVYPGYAEFRPREGETTVISGVTHVTLPSRRQLHRAHNLNWLLATWTKVEYVPENDRPRAAYVFDARWGGYSHYLVNRKLKRALLSLTQTRD